MSPMLDKAPQQDVVRINGRAPPRVFKPGAGWRYLVRLTHSRGNSSSDSVDRGWIVFLGGLNAVAKCSIIINTANYRYSIEKW